MIQRDRIVETFLDLVKINSPSRKERGVADYVKARLSALGFEVTEDNTGAAIGGDSGSVIGYLKGTVEGAQKIFLCCHMDTVEPTDKLNIVVEDGVIKTDGTTILGADDKAGIAAVLDGIGEMLNSGMAHGDIRVLMDVSEEVGLLGARHMDLSLIRDYYGYVMDTQKPVGGITVSAPSAETMNVEVHGKAAHAGMCPEEGISAIIAASNAISKMKLGRIDDETTANVGKIQGGKARNIIPDLVSIKAEARSRNNDKLVEQLQHMRSVFEEEITKMGAKAVITSNREYTAFHWGENDPVVMLAAAASRRLGIDPVYEGGGGGSDANIFNANGVPCVVIGVGYEGAHSPAENVSMDDLAKAAEYVVALIAAAAENAK